MNAERLVEHYEHVADAPGAVARLRRFVLDLAVRGKLVTQDTNDEPASELLERIAQARKRLIVERKIKRAGELAPVSEEEIAFDVPIGWATTRLGAGYDVRDGTHDTPKYVESGYPLITSKNLSSGYLSFQDVKLISEEDYLQIAERSGVEQGDVLVAMIGSIGNPVIVDTNRPFSIKNVALFKYFDPLLSCPKFLRLFLEQATSEMKLLAAGGLQPFVSLSFLRGYPIALPPLAEQHRIVAKVDELMVLCDRLETARAGREVTRDRLAASGLARLNAPDPDTFQDDARFALDTLPAITKRPDQIKRLRQTILGLAVRGKLVPQDSNDEPASKLLQRITIEKMRLVKVGARPEPSQIAAIDPADAPFPVAPSWTWAAFGDMVISRDGERIPVSREERNIRAKNFDYYGASGVIDKIDSYIFDKPLLLIGEDGANLVNRSTPIAFMARGKYWVNNHAHVLDGLSEDLLRYLELFVNAIDLKPYITGMAQPKMNQAKMNSIPIAVPPGAEQRRIVARVDELMALCDQLEASLTTGDDTRRRLLDALLHEALDPPEEEAA